MDTLAPKLPRWSAEKANTWYETMPWLVGSNYLPATAINQIVMWSAATFDAAQITKEMQWAQSLGFNSLRVYLHDIPYFADPAGFLNRMEQFLGIAATHGIGILFVFFDSCWHPFPHSGTQPLPEPGVHNSGWVQSPGVAVLRDTARFDALESYVTAVLKRFGNDKRVHLWDLWNEPCNENTNSYGTRDIGQGKKAEIVLPLLAKVFDWARATNPSQPLSAGVWRGGWVNGNPTAMETFCLEASDMITFHTYSNPEMSQKWLDSLKPLGRPIICTEYMARSVGSTFQAILPIFKADEVGAYNWGFVAGKSQTNYAWDSWQNPYGTEPPLWFHDIFRPDGTPYIEAEVTFIKKMTALPNHPTT